MLADQHAKEMLTQELNIHPGKLVSRNLCRNSIMGAVALGLLLLTGFVAYAFVHCTPGEFAAAVGSIFGGIVGAGGAIAAVYLLINRQRMEDETRITEAITKEIIVFTKIIIDSLKICRYIKAGRIVVQKKNANSLMTYAEPVIYKGVADRIGYTLTGRR